MVCDRFIVHEKQYYKNTVLLFLFLRQHFLMYFWLIIIILYEKMKTGEDENNVQKAGGI